MPAPIRDIGKNFGNWKVVGFIPAKMLGARQGKYVCICTCGKEKHMSSHNMSSLRKNKRMHCDSDHHQVELPKRVVEGQSILDVVKKMYNTFSGPNPYNKPKENLSDRYRFEILCW